MGVVNLVITYKIDGGNLIDFYPSFLSTVNAIVIAQKFPFNNKITNLFIYHLNGLITVLVVVEPFNSVIIKNTLINLLLIDGFELINVESFHIKDLVGILHNLQSTNWEYVKYFPPK
jgi:hypothetical protein